jgi:hypothetical protein
MAELTPQVQWMAAAPLWPQTAGGDGLAIRRPTLLRFASDSFMDEFAAILQSEPARLAAQVARPESFQARPPGQPENWSAPPPATLKLYQPAHGHFNLVVATLVCRLAGLPDRVVDKGKQERVDFVLRRSTSAGELAWAPGSAGHPVWQPPTQPTQLAPGEERLPLFPLTYGENGHRRRLLAGLIPTASREAFQAAPALSPIVVDPKADPRPDDLDNRVIAILASLGDPLVSLPLPQAHDVSLFLLLDLADILVANKPQPWTAVFEANANVSPFDPGRPLYDRLNQAIAGGTPTWLAAMRAVWAQRQTITRGDATNPSLAYDLRMTPMSSEANRAALRADVLKALGPYSQPATPPAIPVPKLDPRGDAHYVLRCVFDRPGCEPFQGPILSEPSVPFVLAPFFDFDAPARPIRISLPVDTSPAGLRKFQKNVGFVLSDKLRQQMDCVKDATGALKGDISCGAGFDFGLICQFSIPLITICALIVLMIFFILLNIVFWWLPFLRICLPIGVKAKPS